MSLQPSCSKIVFCLSQTSSAGFRAQDMNPSSDSSSTKGGGCCWDFCHFPLEGCRLPSCCVSPLSSPTGWPPAHPGAIPVLIQREGTGVCRSHTLSLREMFYWSSLSVSALFPSAFPVPTPVTDIRTDRVEQKSVTLSWQEPGLLTANGTEYEVKYFEKVSSGCGSP